MRVPSRGLARISEQKHEGVVVEIAASEALWYYVVQREACGLRDVETVLREYRVPHEVYLRMGQRPAGTPGR